MECLHPPCFVSGHLNTGLRRVPLPKGKKLHRDFTLDKTLYIVKSLYKKPGRTTPEKKHEADRPTVPGAGYYPAITGFIQISPDNIQHLGLSGGQLHAFSPGWFVL